VNPTRAQFDSHVENPAIVYTKRDVDRLLAKIDVRDVSETVRQVQAATARVNALRSRKIPFAINSRKTQCPKGHALTGDNVIIDNTRGREPGRRCRVCKNDYQRKRWKQWKGERESKQAA
jgi:hypothetical protein